MFADVLGYFTIEVLAHGVVGRGPIRGVKALVPFRQVVADLIIGQAQHFLPAGRIVDFVGLDVPIPDAVTGGVGGEAEALLALQQSGFELFAFADVAAGDHETGLPSQIETPIRDLDGKDRSVLLAVKAQRDVVDQT